MSISSMGEWFAKQGLKPHPADRLIEERANAMRRIRPGEFVPAVEYDWECHQWLIGAKDHAGRWISYVTADDGMSGGMKSVESIARWFEVAAFMIRAQTSHPTPSTHPLPVEREAEVRPASASPGP